jgi:uncharacterized protein YqeY
MEDMKAALKAGEKVKLSTIRLLRAQLQEAEITKGGELSPEEELEVLSSSAKKHKDSIHAYQEANRPDLVEKETQELAIITQYLPEQLSEEEIEKTVTQIIQQVGAVSMKDLGKVMSAAMGELKGKADGRLIQELVRKKLS